MKNTVSTVRLTLHNGKDVLINWDEVAFATPSVSETTREAFTKLVFSSSSAHEVDVRETLDEVYAVLLNVGTDIKTTIPKKIARATGKTGDKPKSK